MSTQAPPEKPPDQARIVAALARRFRVPIEDVARLYEQEHTTLAVDARVTKFLHVFATRHVEDILRQRLALPGTPIIGSSPTKPALV